MTTRLIAVAGGIGSGKSVVCGILRAMGYPVYDCDSRAKAIMDSDSTIKERIACEICAEAICPDGSIDRKRLAQIVFADPAKLSTLNSAVHSAVIIDMKVWAESQQSSLAFVETAILYQSGIDRMVDAVWEVTAPESVRIERVMRRSGLSAEEAAARIEAQRFKPQNRHPKEYLIENGGEFSLLAQINALLQRN